MSDTIALDSHPRVALFDLDGTLTWRDTLVPFLTGYAAQHPARCLNLWQLAPALVRYAGGHDRGLLKSTVIRAVMGGEPRDAVDAWATSFVGTALRRRLFRPEALAVLEAHRTAGHRLVLLSASPDLYVPRIGALLGFERSLCTEVRWRIDQTGAECLDGALRTANRHGEEKSSCLDWLRIQYPGLPVTAYGNSASDLAHMRRADQALLVNGSRGARRAAAGLGIPCGDWN